MCVMFVAMIGSIQKPNAIFEIIFQMLKYKGIRIVSFRYEWSFTI